MTQCYDILVIGGGINGAGIARDAVGRGLKVALVEQSDIGAATSSASTKLIHGGLRYLESYEFRLVRESLNERELLLNMAPHIIHPMEFVLPHQQTLRPRWMIRLGLFLYDHIGGRKKLPTSRSIKIDGTKYGNGLSASIKHGFVYSDCRVDDSRLTLLNAMDAANRSAVIMPRTRFIDAEYHGEYWTARCENALTNELFTLQAKVIVNAAGPWAGTVSHTFQAEASLRLVKGSHIVVPKLYEGEHALLLQNTDGRVVFTIPYQSDYTLIGTTDESFTGDATTVAISDEETQYLCDAVNQYFAKTTTAENVVWTYAGVRPLWDDEAQNNNSKVTRDYHLEMLQTPGPLLNVFGGKITTYRCLAESVMARLENVLSFDRHSWTSTECLPGGDVAVDEFNSFVASVAERWPFLSASLVKRLASTYGTRVDMILGRAKSMAELGHDFGLGLTEAEVSYLQVYEWAMTVDDVIWRRTKLGLQRDKLDLMALEKLLHRNAKKRYAALHLPGSSVRESGILRTNSAFVPQVK